MPRFSQEVEERALSLLLAHLDDKQRKTFLEQGYFEFHSRNMSFGTTWRLYTAEALILRGISNDEHKLITMNYPGRRFGCVGFYTWALATSGRWNNAVHVPEADTLLALKISVEALGKPTTGCTQYHDKRTLDKKLPKGTVLRYSLLAAQEGVATGK